jgi:RNA polymerase sigma factor (sigma-70 family)
MARAVALALTLCQRYLHVQWRSFSIRSCYRSHASAARPAFASFPTLQDRLPMSVTRADQENLEHLLLRTGQNDRDAFAELYRRTSARLFGVCARMLSDRREAEEVLQEAYVTIWQRGGSFDPARASAMTWLIALVRNKAIDRLRQHQNATLDHDFAIDSVADDAPTPASGAESAQEYRRLEECLEELDVQQRRSIREAFFSGNTYNELAERAKVPLGTMKSWIRRGLLQLRACLET